MWPVLWFLLGVAGFDLAWLCITLVRLIRLARIAEGG